MPQVYTQANLFALTKVCTKCRQELPLSAFGKHRGSSLRPRCKTCHAADVREYVQRNHEEVKARKREAYHRDHEKSLEQGRRYREKYREVIREKDREFRRKHRETLRHRHRIYSREFYKKNPGYSHPYHVRRRARLRGAGGHFTRGQFMALVCTYERRCLKCGIQYDITADHVVPISRGGSNDITNIQPLCDTCNKQKFTQTIDYRKSAFAAVLRRRSAEANGHGANGAPKRVVA